MFKNVGPENRMRSIIFILRHQLVEIEENRRNQILIII